MYHAGKHAHYKRGLDMRNKKKGAMEGSLTEGRMISLKLLKLESLPRIN